MWRPFLYLITNMKLKLDLLSQCTPIISPTISPFLVNSVLRLFAAENTQQRRNTFIHKCSQMISLGSFCHSHSPEVMKENHPFSSHVIPQAVVDTLTLCEFKIIWIKSWQKIPSRAIQQKKKNPLLAWEDPKPQIAGGWGNTLGKFYTGSCPCSLVPGQALSMVFQDMLPGWTDPWSYSAQSVLRSVSPPFLVIVIQKQIIILNLVFLTQKANNNLVSILSKR